MKRINLDYLLTNSEIKEFEKIYYDIKQKNEIGYSKQWDCWKKTANWINNLEKRDEFINVTIGRIQNDAINAYKKIVLPRIKKGDTVIPILGTLLGFYRDKDIIQHDDDLDMGYDIFDFEKIRRKLFWISLFKGWHLHVPSWFSKKGKILPADQCARLYQIKTIRYEIGSLEFDSRASIDLWPITKVPDENKIEEDRKFYMIHLQNFYYKNGIEKFTPWKLIEKYFSDDEEAMKFAKNLFGKNNTLKESEDWLKDFYFRSKKSKSKQYMDIEKDMYKIDNFDLRETNEVKIRNIEFIMPNINEEYFEKMYGNWKVKEVSHIHLIRFHKLRKIND